VKRGVRQIDVWQYHDQQHKDDHESKDEEALPN